jgi:hypothetical protein
MVVSDIQQKLSSTPFTVVSDTQQKLSSTPFTMVSIIQQRCPAKVLFLDLNQASTVLTLLLSGAGSYTEVSSSFRSRS